MIISASALSFLVMIALTATFATPVILLALFLWDRNKGKLW